METESAGLKSETLMNVQEGTVGRVTPELSMGSTVELALWSRCGRANPEDVKAEQAPPLTHFYKG